MHSAKLLQFATSTHTLTHMHVYCLHVLCVYTFKQGYQALCKKTAAHLHNGNFGLLFYEEPKQNILEYAEYTKTAEFFFFKFFFAVTSKGVTFHPHCLQGAQFYNPWYYISIKKTIHKNIWWHISPHFFSPPHIWLKNYCLHLIILLANFYPNTSTCI